MNRKENDMYEYCPRCDANLTLQKGFSNDLPYWICKGCGEMLINPSVDASDDIAWICDRCGNMLNIQEGFKDNRGTWRCTCCGFVNELDERNLYDTDDEYQSDLKNPYRGLSDDCLLRLSSYREIEPLKGRDDIFVVSDPQNGQLLIRKFLTTYDRDIYNYLKENPIEHMPRILCIEESRTCLIVIEEYIKGKTVQELIDEGALTRSEAIDIAVSVCRILKNLHDLPTPIVHRDIKPSNIIVTFEGEVYLLDMDAAKWYDPDKTDDTNHIGTRDYAAPEQAGFGFTASSSKSDIYALGVLINVMITGKLPKEKRAPDDIWPLIERCISLDADKRYDAASLLHKLKGLTGNEDEDN